MPPSITTTAPSITTTTTAPPLRSAELLLTFAYAPPYLIDCCVTSRAGSARMTSPPPTSAYRHRHHHQDLIALCRQRITSCFANNINIRPPFASRRLRRESFPASHRMRHHRRGPPIATAKGGASSLRAVATALVAAEVRPRFRRIFVSAGRGFDDMYSVPRGVEGVEVDSLTPRGSRGFGDVIARREDNAVGSRGRGG